MSNPLWPHGQEHARPICPGRDGLSSDVRVEKIGWKQIPLGFRESKDREETDSLGTILERMKVLGVHICVSPAPGMCWVFALFLTTNEMGRASPRRQKGRTGVRSWGCLELPCFCLLYYLGKSPASCLILQEVWLDEYFPKRSKNTGLFVFFSFQNALKTWGSWYFSGTKSSNLDDVAYYSPLSETHVHSRIVKALRSPREKMSI